MDASSDLAEASSSSKSLLQNGVFFAIFTVVGFLFALNVVGWRVLNPLDDSWFAGDPATGYLGWLFFRQQDHLSFPLGWTPSIGYPLGEPIAYLDSLPIVAVMFWPFRHILPVVFQYQGLVFASSCILQFYFGYKITLRIAKKDQASAVLCGALFMMAPAFVWRAFGHFALANHWMILAALYLYTSEADCSVRKIIFASVLCFVAGGTNPYIAAMTLLMVGAAFASPVFVASGTVLRAAIRAIVAFGIAALVTAGALLIFGFIVPSDPGVYSGGGYGIYSMNLLSPIDPMNWPSLLLRAQPTVGEGQYEGYNYLGLGVLLLGVVSFSYRPKLLLTPFKIKYLPGWVVFLISLFLALSLKATVGGLVIYEGDAPTPVLELLSAFRSSGRLFWPAFYLILFCIIGAGIRAYGTRAFPVITVAVAIQMADLRPLHVAIHRQWDASSGRTSTDKESWQEIGRTHRHLVVLPAWQCDVNKTPGSLAGYWAYGKLAAQHGMTINSFYAGRASQKQLDYFCNRELSELQNGGLEKETAYVFSSPQLPLSVALNGHYCRREDGLTLCPVSEGPEGFEKAIIDYIAVVPLNETIFFSSASNEQILGTGWSHPESWGRWSDGTQAKLLFRLPAGTSGPLQIGFDLTAFASPNHPQQVETSIDGNPLARWRFISGEKQSVSVRMPDDVAAKNYVLLSFRLPDATSPAAQAMSQDARRLAIGLVSMRINGR